MPYPGGKAGAGVYQAIINLMPPHQVYIEPFLGGGAIMARKKPAHLNIGVDLDPDVIRKFRSEIRHGTISGSVEFRFHTGNGIQFIQRYPYDGRTTLIYCDPPYVLSARRQTSGMYRFEMTDAEHVDLLKTLKLVPAYVMLSGYPNELYTQQLRGWKTETYNTSNRTGDPIIEYLWFNFEPPAALHDYRYLGQNYRERERIKKKTRRWTHKLARMPLLERRALMHAIEESFPPTELLSPFELERRYQAQLVGNQQVQESSAPENQNPEQHRVFG